VAPRHVLSGSEGVGQERRCTGPENGAGAIAGSRGRVETSDRGGEGQRRGGSAHGGDGEGSDDIGLCEKGLKDVRHVVRSKSEEDGRHASLDQNQKRTADPPLDQNQMIIFL
jgi:hypothetical protein